MKEETMKVIKERIRGNKTNTVLEEANGRMMRKAKRLILRQPRMGTLRKDTSESSLYLMACLDVHSKRSLQGMQQVETGLIPARGRRQELVIQGTGITTRL